MEANEAKAPKVSVLMPAYRQAEYIAEALDSLIAQSYRNWEVAVVDDGSPDDVASVVAPYAEKDPRIRFYHTENHGVSAARNYAASVTDGELIIPLDADDRFHPDYVARCVECFLADPQLSVCYCRWRFFGRTKYTPGLEYSGYDSLLIDNSIFCSAMYRRSDFERIGGYDVAIPFGFEDWEFWIRMLASGGKVAQIPEELFYYRIKKKSRSTELEDRKRECLRYIYAKHKALYDLHFPDFLSDMQELSRYRRRLAKWPRRSFPSRLWHAIRGTV